MRKRWLLLRQILCVANARWDDAPCRLANLFGPLHEMDVEVLFFEPALPIFSSGRRPREGTLVSPGVIAYTLPAFVDWTEEGVAQTDRLTNRNARYIQRCMADHRCKMPLLWLCCPNSVGLLDLLPYEGLVYDCDQDWSAFPPTWEQTLCGEADVVFTASDILRQRLAPFCSNVAVLTNGVDYSLFRAAGETFDAYPADLAAIPRPILGYLGTVDDFTDLDAICYAARNCPQWSFVFVGSFSHLNPGYSTLKRMKNVHLLGEKSRATLPRYLSRFDVCLEPFPGRKESPDILSQRVYQYLASGHPIAAMTENELEQLPDAIYYARFDIEFVSACRFALEEQSPELIARRKAYAQAADWSALSGELVHILESNGLLSFNAT